MIQQITKALTTANTLCEMLQQNPVGARYLLAFAALAAVVYIVR